MKTILFLFTLALSFGAYAQEPQQDTEEEAGVSWDLGLDFDHLRLGVATLRQQQKPSKNSVKILDGIYVVRKTEEADDSLAKKEPESRSRFTVELVRVPQGNLQEKELAEFLERWPSWVLVKNNGFEMSAEFGSQFFRKLVGGTKWDSEQGELARSVLVRGAFEDSEQFNQDQRAQHETTVLRLEFFWRY